MEKKLIISIYMYFTFHVCIGFLTNFFTKDGIVETDKGLVQGVLLTTIIEGRKYYAFRGIPYAKAPVGQLRFKPPIEVDPWKGILVANKTEIQCVQKDQVTRKYQGTEDCLVLNVYTPELQLSKSKVDLKSVLVWIHGGSFSAGAGKYSIYGPDHFMKENVVLVTFNYRLGPFGFMTLNHPDAVGNNGLKDQNLVLRWIKKNIIHFHGNPNSVTIFGESAGATSVDFHVLSDLSKGFFHKSISMSGSPFCPWSFMTPYKAEDQAFYLGKLLNGNNYINSKEELLDILHNASAIDIMKSASRMSKVLPTFLPSIENSNINPNEEKFLKECYLTRYMSNKYNKLPHLMGFTANEALTFSKTLDTFLVKEKQIIEQIDKISSYYPMFSLVLKMFVNLGVITFKTSKLVIYQFIQFASDILFYNGIDMKQRIMMQTKNPNLYYYRMSYDGRRNSYHRIFVGLEVLHGTSHADDIFFLFYPRVPGFPFHYSDESLMILKRTIRMWCNFAKYSDPTPDNVVDPLLNVTWPSTDISGTYLDIGTNLTVKHFRPINTHVNNYKNSNFKIILQSKGCMNETLLNTLLQNPLHPTEYVFNLFLHIITNC